MLEAGERLPLPLEALELEEVISWVGRSRVFSDVDVRVGNWWASGDSERWGFGENSASNGLLFFT